MTRIDDYLNEVKRHLAAPKADKSRILDELRSHLTDQVNDAVAAAGSKADADAITRQVLRDFGEPRELALSYEPERTVIRDSKGEVALQVTRDVARGTGRVLKFTILTLLGIAGFVVLVGAFLTVFLADDFRELAQDYAPEPVYMHDRQCSDPCNGVMDESSFFVHGNAREVRFDLSVMPWPDTLTDPGNLGTVRIQVTDPSGDVRFDRTFTGNEGQEASNIAWQPEQGDWSISYDYTLWRGAVDVEVWTVGLAP